MLLDRYCTDRSTKRSDPLYTCPFNGQVFSSIYLLINLPAARYRSGPGWVEVPSFGVPAIVLQMLCGKGTKGHDFLAKTETKWTEKEPKGCQKRPKWSQKGAKTSQGDLQRTPSGKNSIFDAKKDECVKVVGSHFGIFFWSKIH